MQIEVLTLFPEIFSGFLATSLMGRACERGLLQVRLTNIRDFAAPPHYSVDDSPYGGGAGMVLRPEPLSAAIEAATTRLPQAEVVLLTPSGERFSQGLAQSMSTAPELIFICGRYEGIDQRVIDQLVDRELSLGDFVLMGGEVAAMAIIESTVRLIPSVVGNSQSIAEESFSEGLLEFPHYTKPPTFRGASVPEILLSGNHGKIREWRREQSRAKTARVRPDLLQGPR